MQFTKEKLPSTSVHVPLQMLSTLSGLHNINFHQINWSYLVVITLTKTLVRDFVKFNL